MRSLKTKLNKRSIFQDVASSLGTKMELHGHSMVSQESAKYAYGLESESGADLAEQESIVESVTQTLQEEVGVQEWNEELTDGQRDAATIVMLASGDPASYHAKATESVADGNMILDQSSPDVEVSTESYDARELETLMPVSVAYNVGAARQDEAMETLWPTISIPADQAGLELSVSRVMVHHYFTHKQGGAPTDELFGQRHLVDALIDTNILRNQAIELVPMYNTAPGIFDEQFGPFTVQVDNTLVEAGAIKFGVPFNLIGAGANTQADPFSVHDHTDTIDSLVRLKTVVVEIVDKNDKKSLIPLDVLDLPRTQFQKSSEGGDRELGLSWSTTSYTITGKEIDKSGNEAEALAEFRKTPFDKYVIQLKMSANGGLNTADGNAELSAGSVSIHRFFRQVTRADGSTDLEEVKDAAEITNAKALIKSINLRSFVLDARYANVNRRHRGLLVRTDKRTVKYMIQMQAPVTAMKPITETPSGYDIDAAVQATRVLNSTAGVEELMLMDKRLARYRNASSRIHSNNDVQGIGSFVIRPYYEQKDVDMVKLVNNVSGHTLSEDISSHLTLLIRDRFSKALMVSGWHAAVQCSGKNTNEKPTAVLITDPRTMQYIMTKGDTRTLGDRINLKAVESSYLEFRNTIFVTVQRESSLQQPDGLSWGNMFWLPELVTSVPATRNNQISHEFTTNTRRRHICHCPILLRFDIKNLDKVVDTKVPMSIVQ